MSRVKDETGKRYGKLVVLERASSKNGKATWLCRCDCGKQIITTGDELRRGQVTTCGATKHAAERMKQIGANNAIDITGQRFGKLIALESTTSTEWGGRLWKCRCDCGNIHYVELSNLKTGKVQSCGCLKSTGEQEIQQLLTKFHIEFKTQYTPKNWRFKNGYKPFYDFAIFKNDVLLCLLEYNGIQHRTYSNHGWNTKENFDAVQRRDVEKQELCQKYDIPLYIIWYDEDITQSLLYILKEKLKFEF